MTFTQTRTYLKGVLKGWFTNKEILDKLTESDTGDLMFNNTVVNKEETLSDKDITEAVNTDIAELNTYTTTSDTTSNDSSEGTT